MSGIEPTQVPLIDLPVLPGRFVNARCIIHEQDGLRVAVVAGSPFHTWPIGDVVAENLFVVQARQAQVATIEELAVVRLHSRRRRWVARRAQAVTSSETPPSVGCTGAAPGPAPSPSNSGAAH